jgi:hypothetical protein
MTASKARLLEGSAAPGAALAGPPSPGQRDAGGRGGRRAAGFTLVTAWFDNEEGGIHRIHYLSFGILYLTSAAVALTWRPERKTSVFFQIAATALAAMIGGLVSADGNYLTLGLGALAAAAILLALHPPLGYVFRPTMGATRLMSALALAGSVPFVWFA